MHEDIVFPDGIDMTLIDEKTYKISIDNDGLKESPGWLEKVQGILKGARGVQSDDCSDSKLTPKGNVKTLKFSSKKAAGRLAKSLNEQLDLFIEAQEESKKPMARG